ncbi:MAG: CYTH domain-containing protein [Patescibacteria group bacterium]
MNTKEIECRFLEIDKEALVKKLFELGAVDHGETMLEETICYDPELKWLDEQKFVRLRKTGDKTHLAYKHHQEHSVDGAYEIEFEIGDYEKAELLLEKIGLLPYRHQQKKRHTFQLNGVTVDIDTWPQIPAYVEIEGESESALKKVADLLGLNWETANFHNARFVIENIYKIPVGTLRWFTFERVE